MWKYGQGMKGAAMARRLVVVEETAQKLANEAGKPCAVVVSADKALSYYAMLEPRECERDLILEWIKPNTKGPSHAQA